MSKEVIIRMRDDLDNSVEEHEGDIETVKFSYGGKAYEIDLNTGHRAEFDELMTTYVQAARPAPRKSPKAKETKASPVAVAPSPQGREGIRQWANENGFRVGPYGKIPREVCEAYDRAHRFGHTA